MMSPRSLTNSKYGLSGTPLTCPSNNLRPPPPRKLWQNENASSLAFSDKWHKHRHREKENWDVIHSPQFVDFSNVSESGDSFFNRVTVIVSTPKPNFGNEKLPTSTQADETLTQSINNFSLSGIKFEPLDETNNYYDNGDETLKEQYVVHESSVKVPKIIKEERQVKVKKPTTTVNPFSFDVREKIKQERKQEVKCKVEEDNKRVFRANPVPKFLKTRPPVTFSNNNNNNDKIGKNVNENIKRSSSPEKHVKKCTEVWKKPPFIPILYPKKNMDRSKTPPLSTAIRAQERKRFDEAIREKERRKEMERQMELAAKKKQEEEEIMRLRQLSVHKANPVPKYKSGLPKIVKRPLTDPVSPLLFKRRRRA